MQVQEQPEFIVNSPQQSMRQENKYLEDIMVTVKVKNLSDKAIPQELVDQMLFNNIDPFNKVAEEYNLKVIELKNIFNDENVLVEQELTIGDSYR